MQKVKVFQSKNLQAIVCQILKFGHFEDIKKHASVIENRLDDSYCTLQSVLEDNEAMLKECVRYGVDYVLIDKDYKDIGL